MKYLAAVPFRSEKNRGAAPSPVRHSLSRIVACGGEINREAGLHPAVLGSVYRDEDMIRVLFLHAIHDRAVHDNPREMNGDAVPHMRLSPGAQINDTVRDTEQATFSPDSALDSKISGSVNALRSGIS